MTDHIGDINEMVARKLGKPLQTNGGLIMNLPILDYCHSIEAATEIMESLKGKANISLSCSGKKWHVTFEFRKPKHDVVRSDADTAPMAICLAFLKMDLTST